jgi:hypothetical protein
MQRDKGDKVTQVSGLLYISRLHYFQSIAIALNGHQHLFHINSTNV